MIHNIDNLPLVIYKPLILFAFVYVGEIHA